MKNRLFSILSILVLLPFALMQGCAGTNPVQATIETGPLTLEPALGDYGQTKLLNSSTPQLFVLTNPATNTGSAIITSVVTESDQFTIEPSDSTCPSVGTLPAGLSCKIVVKFTPTNAGRQTAKLTVTDSGSNSPQAVNLVGVGNP
jgi:hypothetical protein